MTSPTPRQTRRAKRLKAITDAALDLVVEDGIEGFSVHRLAERVDLTPGALYRYFDGRDEILIAVQAEVLAVFDVYLENVVDAVAGRPLLERIVLTCRAYLALADLQPQRFRLNSQFVGALQPVFDDVGRVTETAHRTQRMLSRLGLLIAQAQLDGVLRAGEATHRAVVAWSSLHALVERRKLERIAPVAFSPAALERELLRTLLCGWGAGWDEAEEAVDASIPDGLFVDAMEAV